MMAQGFVLSLAVLTGLPCGSSALLAQQASNQLSLKVARTLAQNNGHERTFGAASKPGKITPWMGRKATALVVLSHWIPGDGKNGSEHAREKVEKSLNGTLGEIRQWAVDATIVLVTNEYNTNVSSQVSHQVVTGREPWCNATFQFKLCMPWEALKALRNASSDWAAGCDLYSTAACGVPKFDYYVYGESDIRTPKETFEFWATHAESLHKRGYLLLPHREERFDADEVLTDCYDEDCWKRTAVYKDEAGPAELYKDSQDRMYVLPGNPYAGCFFLTSAMFDEWLASTMWDYSSAMLLSKPPVGNIKSWGKRESATGGLLWDPRYGASKGLTHLRMKVFHASHMHHVPFTADDYRRVSEVQELVQMCSEGSVGQSRCRSLQ